VKALRKLILGETWLLPGGVAVLMLGSGLILKPLLDSSWRDAGGPILAAGVVALLLASVHRR
jgi:hypothetical protein